MTQSNQLGDYLRHLTPQARSSLLIELERLEVCGAAIPGAAAVLEKLRAEFRKGGQTNHRVANPSRHFFLPLEPMLVDGAPEHDNCGHILRGSLAAIWEWISHDLLPTMASDYAAQMRPLIASDNQAEIRKVAATFQTKVYKYLENALTFPEGADRARAKLATYTASRSVFGDLTKIIIVLRARDALARLNSELPPTIVEFGQAQVAKATVLLDAFGRDNAAALPFALALVAMRLKTFSQLIRLATEAGPSRNAADIAATPYAVVVSMVLDQLEDKGTALRAALQNNRKLPPKVEVLVDDAVTNGGKSLLAGTVHNISSEALHNIAVELQLRKRTGSAVETRVVTPDSTDLPPDGRVRYRRRCRRRGEQVSRGGRPRPGIAQPAQASFARRPPDPHGIEGTRRVQQQCCYLHEAGRPGLELAPVSEGPARASARSREPFSRRRLKNVSINRPETTNLNHQ